MGGTHEPPNMSLSLHPRFRVSTSGAWRMAFKSLQWTDRPFFCGDQWDPPKDAH